LHTHSCKWTAVLDIDVRHDNSVDINIFIKKEVSEDDKKKAEELKVQGNRKVAERNYPEAIRFYSEAISVNPNNAVFYGNR
jgi:hypothetical protein